MFNRDGSFEYSKIVTLKAKGSETVTVYPNPVINELFANISVDKAQTVMVKLNEL